MSGGTGDDADGAAAGEYEKALDAAHRHALKWLGSVDERPIRPDLDADGIHRGWSRSCPRRDRARGRDRRAAQAAAPGLMAMGSPRFYGFVIGGAYPPRWRPTGSSPPGTRTPGSRQPTPATAAVEETAAALASEAPGPPGRQRRRIRHGRHEREPSALIVARDTVLRDVGLRHRQRHPGRADDPVPGGGAVHTSVVLAGRIAGIGAPQDRRRRRAGPHRRRRADRCARRARRSHDRRAAGGRRPLRALSTTSGGDRRPRTCTAPGCTSTARSGCGRRHPHA
jgi:hypothetical protein